MSDGGAARAAALEVALNEILFGKPELVRLVVASFFAGGHVLLEGLPGLGKTVLARSMARMTGLDYKRLQFTPDLMPADVTGTHLIDETSGGREFSFVPGPVFTHFLLADEINRASPKTQAALLEAMAEGTVSQLGVTRPIEPPFFVMATQNPIEMEGVNPLPEAQLDRFAVKLLVPATAEEDLLRIIERRTRGPEPELRALLDRDAVLACRAEVEDVFLPKPVAVLMSRLIARLSPQHAEASEAVRAHVTYGPSPRAVIWLARVSRALAYLDGREGVGFEDAMLAAPHVLGHRLILGYSARLDGVTPGSLVRELHERLESELIGRAEAS